MVDLGYRSERNEAFDFNKGLDVEMSADDISRASLTIVNKGTVKKNTRNGGGFGTA